MKHLDEKSVDAITRKLRTVATPSRDGDAAARLNTPPAFWARITAVSSAGLYSWKRVVFDEAEDDNFGDWPVTATGTENARAIGGGSAVEDDIVRLYLVGLDDDAKPVHVFAGDGMRFAKVVGIRKSDGTDWTSYQTDNEYPRFCIARPCMSDGTNVATQLDVFVLLSHLPNSPLGLITAEDEVIGYLPGDRRTLVALSGTQTRPATGQAVFGFGCWLDWIRFVIAPQ